MSSDTPDMDMRQMRQRIDLVEGERDAAYEMAQGLIEENRRLKARLSVQEDVSARLADYAETLAPGLDTRQQQAEVRELIAAWRALVAPLGGREGEA